nr:hypothetical protein [uncultured Pseudomonas sp.]
MSRFPGDEHLGQEIQFTAPSSGWMLTQESAWSEALPDLLPQLWRFALIIVDSELFAERLILEACARIMSRTGRGAATLAPISSMYAEIYDVWKEQICRLSSQPDSGERCTHAYREGVSPNREITGPAIARPGRLGRMSTEQRIVIFLLQVERHHYLEVGHMLGIPGSQVLKVWVEASKVLGLNRTSRTMDWSQGQRCD